MIANAANLPGDAARPRKSADGYYIGPAPPEMPASSCWRWLYADRYFSVRRVIACSVCSVQYVWKYPLVLDPRNVAFLLEHHWQHAQLHLVAAAHFYAPPAWQTGMSDAELAQLRRVADPAIVAQTGKHRPARRNKKTPVETGVFTRTLLAE